MGVEPATELSVVFATSCARGHTSGPVPGAHRSATAHSTSALMTPSNTCAAEWRGLVDPVEDFHDEDCHLDSPAAGPTRARAVVPQGARTSSSATATISVQGFSSAPGGSSATAKSPSPTGGGTWPSSRSTPWILGLVLECCSSTHTGPNSTPLDKSVRHRSGWSTTRPGVANSLTYFSARRPTNQPNASGTVAASQRGRRFVS